jgi:hypothetical protein
MNHQERAPATASADATILRGARHEEQARAVGRFTARLVGPREFRREEYLKLDTAARAAAVESHRILCRDWHLARLAGRVLQRKNIEAMLADHIIEQKWSEHYPNVVTTEGGNYLLDCGLRAQAQITAWFLGLITSTSFTAVAAADTAAQINGTNQWKEAGATTGPNYTGTRQALTVGNAASAKTLTASAVSSFPMLAAGTIKGTFLASASAKDATTGKLYSAGLFTSGDKVLGNGDTLQVTYAASV